jgi:hypothetical protein
MNRHEENQLHMLWTSQLEKERSDGRFSMGTGTRRWSNRVGCHHCRCNAAAPWKATWLANAQSGEQRPKHQQSCFNAMSKTIRIVIPDEVVVSRTLSFSMIEDALAALVHHDVLRVEIDDLGTMTREEFEAYCLDRLGVVQSK